MRKVLIFIIGIALTIVLLIFLHYAILSMTGHYVYQTGWRVAEILVKDGKSVQDCFRIRWPIVGAGPSQGEQKRMCIYDYAKLSKDPTACELLMPSEYGKYCIADALHEAVQESFCTKEK